MYSRQLTESMNRLTRMYAAVQKTVELQIQELCRQSPHIKQTEKPFYGIPIVGAIICMFRLQGT